MSEYLSLLTHHSFIFGILGCFYYFITYSTVIPLYKNPIAKTPLIIAKAISFLLKHRPATINHIIAIIILKTFFPITSSLNYTQKYYKTKITKLSKNTRIPKIYFLGDLQISTVVFFPLIGYFFSIIKDIAVSIIIKATNTPTSLMDMYL